MRKSRAVAALGVVISAAFFIGWTPFHIELNASYPEVDQVLGEAPTEMWLEFSVAPDMERSSFSVRGAEGSVELGEISAGDSPKIIRAGVEGELEPGDYTVSWVAAPMDDHAVRGRFTFTVQPLGR